MLEKKVDQSSYVDDLRDKLMGLGLNEIVTNSLVNQEKALKFGDPIDLMNPQTVEMSHLRTSLIPGALTTVRNNLNVREHNLSIFEIGHTFERIGNDRIKSFENISEKEMLIILLTGQVSEDEWHSKAANYSVYHLKGLIEELFGKLGVLEKVTKSYTSEMNNLKNAVAYDFSNEIFATIGQLPEDVLKQFDIDQDVFVAQVDIGLLKSIEVDEKTFSLLLKYPKIVRDFAFVLDKNITVQEVEDVIKQGSSKLLQNIKLFDIFESDSLGEGKKSLAFQLEYFDKSRTLTEEEVDKDFWKAIENVKKKFNAELRGG